MSLLQLMLITPPSSEHPKLEIVGLVKRNHDVHKKSQLQQAANNATPVQLVWSQSILSSSGPMST